MADDYLEPVTEKSPNRPIFGYEYLDHTADVQLHAWGPSLKEAFEQCAKAMFGYITELGLFINHIHRIMSNYAGFIRGDRFYEN